MILIYLLLIVLILILFVSPTKENNSNDIKYNGSLHILGRLDINSPNKKLRFNKLAITDSVTNKTSTLDFSQLSYLMNTKSHRTDLICLDDTCISQKHLEILKGQRTFKLKDKVSGNCMKIDGDRVIQTRHDDDYDWWSHRRIYNPIFSSSCNVNRPGVIYHGSPIEFKLRTIVNNEPIRSSKPPIRPRPKPRTVYTRDFNLRNSPKNIIDGSSI